MPMSRTNSLTTGSSVSATYEGIALPPGPSLAHLPDPVVYQFLRIARSVICSKFVPILWVRAARRRRERQRIRRPIAIEHMGCARACEAALNDSSEFVQSASASSELSYFLAKKGQHITYQPGEIIFHHGEVNNTGVHVLVSGRTNLFSLVHREKDSTRCYGFHNIVPPSSMSSIGPPRVHTKKPQQQHPTTFSTPVVSSPVPAFGVMQEFQNGLADTSVDGVDEDADGVSPARRGVSDPATIDFRGDHHPQHLRFAKMKSKGLTNTHYVRSATAPFVFGDLAILNDEHRLFYAVAATVVDVIVVPRSAFFAALQGLPTINGPLRVVSVAHAVRAANLTSSFPLTLARLRLSPLFLRFTDEELQLLLVCAQPKVFAQGTTVLDRNRPCHHVYLVRRGLVEETKERGASPHTSQQRTTVALWEGATFGEREAYFKERSDAQYVASTNVDLYQIPMEEVMRMCTRSELLKSRVAEAAKQLRVYDPHEDVLQGAKAAAAAIASHHTTGSDARAGSGQQLASTVEFLAMSNKHKRYVDLMQAIPLWSAVGLPRELLEALAPHWVSQLYSRGECIFYKSDMCDKLVIVMRGNAKLLDATPSIVAGGHVLTPGECVGYTCLLEHRWQFSAMATEVTEVISLTRAKLVETLKLWDTGVLRPHTDGGSDADAILIQSELTARSNGEGDSMSAAASATVLQNALVAASPSKKKSTMFHQKLIHATTQLLQPLFRRSQTVTTALHFPALDAVTRRAPNPNSFEHLTIVNLHPISREEHVRLYPPYGSGDHHQCRHGAVIVSSDELRLKKQFSSDLQKFQAKQQLMRRGLGSSGSLHVDGGVPHGGRRRSTAAASADSTPSSTNQHHRFPSTTSPVQQAANLSAAATSVGDHALPKFQLPDRPPSRTTKPDDSAVKTDNVGNMLVNHAIPQPPPRVAPITSPTPSGLRPHSPGGTRDVEIQSFKASMTVSGMVDTAHALSTVVATTSPSKNESGGAVDGVAAATSDTLRSHVERIEGPSADAAHTGALEDIFRPVRSHKRQSVADMTAFDELLSAPTSPKTVVSRSASGRDGDSGAIDSTKHIQPPPPQPVRASRAPHAPVLLRRSRPAAHVTPKAKKTLTYSATENFGSLMQSMVQRCQSPRGRVDPSPQNALDSTAPVNSAGSMLVPAPSSPSDAQVVRASDNGCKAQVSTPRFMWQSTSVATPLLPSRPASAVLASRCAEALREKHHADRRYSRSPRCTAYHSQRSYIQSLVDASKGPTSPIKRM